MILYVNDMNFMIVLNVSKENYKTIDLLYTSLKFYTLIYENEVIEKIYFTAIVWFKTK